MRGRSEPANIEDAFAEALRYPPEVWGEFGDFWAKGDLAARTELLELLEAWKASADFLETPPAITFLPSADGLPESGQAIEQVGGFRILRQLGAGGMGEVYLAVREAEGFEHYVAIKRIKPGRRGRVLHERFLAERRILARLDHPNIGKLFDGGTLDDGSPYLVMEFIDGSPVDVHCEFHETPLHDRARMVRDVARAVAYAHQRGVLHRDIKPGNILLNREGVPKLVDFGIAMTADGQFSSDDAGVTPEYASPEQVRGEAGDARSDVYSLGVVLYELITGQRPHTFASRMPEAVDRVLANGLPSWEGLEVPRPLRTILEHALAYRADDRYTTAGELADALEAWIDEPPKPESALSMRALAGSCAVMLVMLAAWVFYQIRGRGAAGSPPNRTLVVAPFRSLASNPSTAWMTEAARELIASEFAGGSSIRTLTHEEMERARLNFPKLDANALPEAWRSALGVSYVAAGSILAAGDAPDAALRLDVRLLDAASGRMLVSATEQGSVSELAALVTRVSAKLGGALGMRTGTGARFGSNEALRLYARGVERLDRFDPLGARLVLERVVVLDPANSLAHLTLARALHALGYGVKAREEAEAALRFAPRALPAQLRLRMEAFACRVVAQYGCAAEKTRELAALDRGNAGAAAELALTLHRAGRKEEANATIARAHQLAGPGGNWEVDSAEVTLAQLRGETPKLCEAALRLRDRARALEAPILEAQALHSLAACKIDSADSAAAAAFLDQTERLYHERGYRVAALRVAGTRANLAMMQGGAEDAARTYVSLAGKAREIGHVEFEGQSLGNAAVAYVRAGQYSKGLPLAEQSIPLLAQSGYRSAYGNALNTLGAIYATLNRPSDAIRSYREAARIGAGIGSPQLESMSWFNLCGTAIQSGGYREFREAADKGIAAASRSGWAGSEMAMAAAKAAMAIHEGPLRDAIPLIEESMRIARKLQDPEALAHAHYSLAWAHLLRGEPREGAKAALSGTESVDRNEMQWLAGQLWAVAAMAQAEIGETGQARASLSRARQRLTGTTGMFAHRLQPFAEAWVLARSGSLAQAEAMLRDWVRKDAAVGLGILRYDAALELIRIQRLMGRTAEAERTQQWLSADAERLGLRRVVASLQETVRR